MVDEKHTYKYFEWYVAKKDTGTAHKESIEIGHIHLHIIN